MIHLDYQALPSRWLHFHIDVFPNVKQWQHITDFKHWCEINRCISSYSKRPYQTTAVPPAITNAFLNHSGCMCQKYPPHREQKVGYTHFKARLLVRDKPTETKHHHYYTEVQVRGGGGRKRWEGGDSSLIPCNSLVFLTTQIQLHVSLVHDNITPAELKQTNSQLSTRYLAQNVTTYEYACRKNHPKH